jgi:hypothetical protein
MWPMIMLQLGETVEHARRDDAQRMQARLHAEAVDGAVQAAFLERPIMLRWQRIGVQVDRRIQGLGGGKDVPELAVRQVLALRMRIDDHGIHAQLRHPALDFLGGRCGSCGATAIMPVKRVGWRRMASASWSLATRLKDTAWPCP